MGDRCDRLGRDRVVRVRSDGYEGGARIRRKAHSAVEIEGGRLRQSQTSQLLQRHPRVVAGPGTRRHSRPRSSLRFKQPDSCRQYFTQAEYLDKASPFLTTMKLSKPTMAFQMMEIPAQPSTRHRTI
mmetsp:Transcript_3289/g.13188  ORF Transcript_3289/g.13188 Transcript_3289/m.13188 type:complete len:127 (+) Transcript_3289:514-894(+)